MKNLCKFPILLFIGAVLVLSLMPILVLAEDVALKIVPDDITINTTETKAVDIIITNNQADDDTFSLSIWPSTTWAGVTPNLEKYSIDIEAGANATTKLYLSVSSEAEEIISTFLVTAKSKFSDASASISVNVRVKKKSPVYISDLALDKYVVKPEDCVNITTSVTNVGVSPDSYKIQTTVKRGTSIIKRFDTELIEIEGRSIKSVSSFYCFEKYAETGTYSVEAMLKTEINKFVDSRAAAIRMNELSNLVMRKTASYTPFVQAKAIDIKNEGNLVESNFTVTETVSEFMSRFFYPIDTPTSIKEQDGKKVYSWVVESLKPGEATQIKYELRFAGIWISGISLAVLVFLAFSYFYRPTISKSARFLGTLKKGKEMVVLLELRNSTIHEIKSVVVQDAISPIVTLLEKFDTMTPTIEKSEAGTTLTWRIKSLSPLEERVLTYRIRPKVDIIGSMRLPRATMEYFDHKKQKKVVASGSIEIK